jgi:hypothetical protein
LIDGDIVKQATGLNKRGMGKIKLGPSQTRYGRARIKSGHEIRREALAGNTLAVPVFC